MDTHYVAWLRRRRDALIRAYSDTCARHGDGRPRAARDQAATMITDMLIASGGDEGAIRERARAAIQTVIARGISDATAVIRASQIYREAAAELLDADELDAEERLALTRDLQRAILTTTEATVTTLVDVVESQRRHAEELLTMEHAAACAEDAQGLLDGVLAPLRARGQVSAALWYANGERAASTGDALAVALAEPRLRPLVETAELRREHLDGAEVGALLCLPLVGRGERDGTLVLAWPESRAPSEDERDLAEAAARTLAPLVAHRFLLATLERHVADRTAQLQSKLDVIERQSELIRELSTPILQIWRGVLVMPLIGVFEGARGARITEAMLERVVERQARWVILDVTGLDQIDARIFDELLGLVRSARLLGARCVLTGVRPEVAAAMVRLDVDLGQLVALRTLEAGLRHCVAALERG